MTSHSVLLLESISPIFLRSAFLYKNFTCSFFELTSKVCTIFDARLLAQTLLLTYWWNWHVSSHRQRRQRRILIWNTSQRRKRNDNSKSLKKIFFRFDLMREINRFWDTFWNGKSSLNYGLVLLALGRVNYYVILVHNTENTENYCAKVYNKWYLNFDIRAIISK